MTFLRPIQWYHSHADPVWPDGTFNWRGKHSYSGRQIRDMCMRWILIGWRGHAAISTCLQGEEGSSTFWNLRLNHVYNMSTRNYTYRKNQALIPPIFLHKCLHFLSSIVARDWQETTTIVIFYLDDKSCKTETWSSSRNLLEMKFAGQGKGSWEEFLEQHF